MINKSLETLSHNCTTVVIKQHIIISYLISIHWSCTTANSLPLLKKENKGIQFFIQSFQNMDQSSMHFSAWLNINVPICYER